MARKKENDAALGGLILLAGLAYLLFHALHIGSIAFGFLLVFPLAYFCLHTEAQRQRRQQRYDAAFRGRLHHLRHYSGLIAAYSDLRVTQKGRYDERSYRGKEANVNIDQARHLLAASEAELDASLTYYKWLYFFRTAVCVYAACLLVLWLSDISSPFAPAFCLIAALLAGGAAYAQAREEYRQGETPGELPQANPLASLSFIGLWTVSALLFNHTLTAQPDTAAASLPQFAASPATKQPGASDDDQTETAITLADSDLFTPHEERAGFLLRDAEAYGSFTDRHGGRVLLQSGQEVTITAASADGTWFRIRHATHGTKPLYIPRDSIAVFSE